MDAYSGLTPLLPLTGDDRTTAIPVELHVSVSTDTKSGSGTDLGRHGAH